ncbi:MAG: hypothetical protein ACYDAM_02950 [Leptospirales bacterium]
MKSILAGFVLLLVLASPGFAWDYAVPGPSSGFGGAAPAPNPPQSLWMQQVGPNTELYQNPYNPSQGGVVQQVAPGTTITTPNNGSLPTVCQQTGPMTVCQ